MSSKSDFVITQQAIDYVAVFSEEFAPSKRTVFRCVLNGKFIDVTQWVSAMAWEKMLKNPN